MTGFEVCYVAVVKLLEKNIISQINTKSRSMIEIDRILHTDEALPMVLLLSLLMHSSETAMAMRCMRSY